MFYYRSHSEPRPLALATARLTSTAALACYPLGALVLGFGGDTLGAKLIGYGLIASTLFLAAFLAATPLQRIVAEEARKLDEYELALRSAAMRGAYAALSGLVALGIVYAGFAADQGWWVPSTYEHFNALFWGAFAYCFLLPGFFLAWQADAADLAPGE